MPTWGELLAELSATNPPDFDGVRRRYLAQAREKTGRAVILYASKWTQSSAGQNIDDQAIMIVDEDMQGLMETMYEVEETELDLVVHSPGGSPDAAEAIVTYLTYLRSKFEHNG